MRLVFTESAWKDYLWFQTNDRKLLKRINTLIKETLRSPQEAAFPGKTGQTGTVEGESHRVLVAANQR